VCVVVRACVRARLCVCVRALSARGGGGGGGGVGAACMKVVEKRCYSTPFGPTNWFAAEQNCVNWGGHLFSYDTPATYAVATDVFPTQGFWLGLSRTSDSPWRFTDGTATSAAVGMWAPGEPSGNSGVSPVCAWSAPWTTNTKIDDVGCYQVAAPYICVRKLDDSVAIL
jgi:hypothetical protein